MKTLTDFQINVINRLRKQNCWFLAEATERHWKNGESYYIDKRVNVKGIRRDFEKCNKIALETK